MLHRNPSLRHIPTDPTASTERVADFPALPFPQLLAEQRAAWRQCWYGQPGTKEATERFVATVARLEREEAGR